MGRVADPLRSWARAVPEKVLGEQLMACADAIDADHEARMYRCRRETKRAFAKYLRAITAEYEQGIKRKRLGEK